MDSAGSAESTGWTACKPGVHEKALVVSRGYLDEQLASLDGDEVFLLPWEVLGRGGDLDGYVTRTYSTTGMTRASERFDSRQVNVRNWH